jgi:glycosyltransferase involved in cell wall biosynthesis
MRILHWHSNCLSGGGVANAVLVLAESQVRLGTEVVVAAAKPSGPPLYGPLEMGAGVTVIAWQPLWTCELSGIAVRGVPGEAVRRLRAFRPDLVHVHGAFNPENLWVPILIERPIVFSPHGGFHPDVFANRRRLPKHLYFNIEKRLLHNRVRAFHALSTAEVADIAHRLPGRRVYCVPQTSNMAAELWRVREVRPRSDNRVRYVFVGRLDVVTKGLDILLGAFAEAERRLAGREITLTLVGPDWRGSLAWLRRRTEGLGIARRVVLTGAVSSREVASILHQSDIYVQLSRHDGFPVSVSEALLAGKPVILSQGVGHASYAEVASLPHVRVVPPRPREAVEAILDFAHRIAELRKMAEQCRAKVAEFFSGERIAGLHLETYERILAVAPRQIKDVVRQGAGP